MKASNFSFLYVPIDNYEAACNIAEKLISEKMAICVNLLPQGDSFYIWDGKMARSKEYIMLVKVMKNIVPKVRDLIEEMHPYDIPSIAEIEITSLNEKYINWAQ